MPINIFEKIKRTNDQNKEFWSARELMSPLGYSEWRKFEGAIERAKEACVNSGQKINDHFVHADKMVLIGSEAKREVSDIHLSRYACYLVAQNGDSRKEEIALAQTYFALQTRRQELTEQLTEDKERIFLREDMKDRNKKLTKTIEELGGTMPEKLPTVENIKTIRRRLKFPSKELTNEAIDKAIYDI